MDLAYQYTARTKIGQSFSGVIYARTQDFAYVKLRRAGLTTQKLAIDPSSTLKGWMHTKFNQRDLSRFYGTIGKRINNGRPIHEGLMPAADFVDDPRLKQAILIVQQAIADGSPLSHAMKIAGFEERDAMAIRAAEESGKTGDAFISLSVDVARREKLSSQLRSMFFMPKIMMGALYIGSFFAVWLLAPKLEHFMKQINLKKGGQDGIQELYFGAAHWVNDHVVLGVLLWVLPVAFIVWWVKSGRYEPIADKFDAWRLISEKSDMSSTWTAFGLLYDAGVPPYECAHIVRAAAQRESSKNQWRQLERNFLDGNTISNAVETAAFPNYIISAIKASESSGSSLPEEIRGFCLTLEEDVSILTERFKMVADIWIKITLATAIFMAAQVTILPYLRLLITNA